MEEIKIIIVEDESIVALDIQQRLEAMGYSVVATAASGEDAIEQCEATPPDLVLMDIRLNGEIDGIETAGHIRSHADIASRRGDAGQRRPAARRHGHPGLGPALSWSAAD